MSDAAGPIVISVAAAKHAGSRSAHNEDAFVYAPFGGPRRVGPGVERDRYQLEGGFVLGVFDGMGGHRGGDVASSGVARAIVDALEEEPRPANDDALRQRLLRAVDGAQRWLLEAVKADASVRGAGTTATVAALVDACAVLVHVGDSRAFLLRGRRLVQLTQDDRLTPDVLRASGKLTEEEIAAFPHQRVITKAVGIAEELTPAVTRVVLRRADTLLLCTDGLWEIVGAPTIRAILLRQPDPGAACRVLVGEALRAGGARDDLAVIVARFDGEGLRPPIRAESLSG